LAQFDILPNGAVEMELSIEYISRYALLTNDAINAASMEINKINSIAANDRDSERLEGVKVWGLLQQTSIYSLVLYASARDKKFCDLLLK
jgi:predicted nucleic acid-binding protein